MLQCGGSARSDVHSVIDIHAVQDMLNPLLHRVAAQCGIDMILAEEAAVRCIRLVGGILRLFRFDDLQPRPHLGGKLNGLITLALWQTGRHSDHAHGVGLQRITRHFQQQTAVHAT